MNYRMMGSIIGKVLLGEAALMLLPLVTALICRESIVPFLAAIAIAAAVGGALQIRKPKTENIYAREGFVAEGLSWIVLSLVGGSSVYGLRRDSKLLQRAVRDRLRFYNDRSDTTYEL